MKKTTGDRLLWVVAGAFLLLVAAWAAVFVIAHHHPVEPVPLVTGGGGK